MVVLIQERPKLKMFERLYPLNLRRAEVSLAAATLFKKRKTGSDARRATPRIFAASSKFLLSSKGISLRPSTWVRFPHNTDKESRKQMDYFLKNLNLRSWSSHRSELKVIDLTSSSRSLPVMYFSDKFSFDFEAHPSISESLRQMLSK